MAGGWVAQGEGDSEGYDSGQGGQVEADQATPNLGEGDSGWSQGGLGEEHHLSAQWVTGWPKELADLLFLLKFMMNKFST